MNREMQKMEYSVGQLMDRGKDVARGSVCVLVLLVVAVPAIAAEPADSSAIIAEVTAEDEGADCIRVTDTRYEVHAQKIGGADIDWQATIENQCEEELDVHFSLHAMDGDDSSLYSARIVELFRSREARALSGAFYIPSHVADNIKAFAVRVERGRSRM